MEDESVEVVVMANTEGNSSCSLMYDGFKADESAESKLNCFRIAHTDQRECTRCDQLCFSHASLGNDGAEHNKRNGLHILLQLSELKELVKDDTRSLRNLIIVNIAQSTHNYTII